MENKKSTIQQNTHRHSEGNTTCVTQVQPRHTGDATHPKPCFEIANTNAQEKLTTQSLLTVTALETGPGTEATAAPCGVTLPPSEVDHGRHLLLLPSLPFLRTV